MCTATDWPTVERISESRMESMCNLSTVCVYVRLHSRFARRMVLPQPASRSTSHSQLARPLSLTSRDCPPPSLFVQLPPHRPILKRDRLLPFNRSTPALIPVRYLTDTGLPPPYWTQAGHLSFTFLGNESHHPPATHHHSASLPFPPPLSFVPRVQTVLDMAYHHHTPRGSLERRAQGLGVNGANRSVSSFASPLGEVDNKSDGSSVTIKASKFNQWDRGWVAMAGLGRSGADAETDPCDSRCNI